MCLYLRSLYRLALFGPCRSAWFRGVRGITLSTLAGTLIFFPGLAFSTFKVPSLTGPVMDQAGVLSRSARQNLSKILFELNQSGLVQMQVLTVDSLEGESIEQASIKVTDSWKLGDKDRDNGLLILIALKERKVRLEVGQGLEGDLPDALASRIIRGEMLPRFKQNDYDGGVFAAVSIIHDIVAPNLDSAAIKEYKDSKRQKEMLSQILVLLAVLFILFIGSRSRGGLAGFLLGTAMGRGGFRGGPGGFGGGFGGGGGWSGGGGGFSGGGASGGW